jgi:hypothetical protein
MIPQDIWINFMFLNLISKLTPIPPLFFLREGAKKTSYSPSLAKRRGWGMSFEHSDFLANTTFTGIFALRPIL